LGIGGGGGGGGCGGGERKLVAGDWLPGTWFDGGELTGCVG